ncbi:MAG TPA: S9 family peptidase, partial [Candidatus Polarisedimenticolia bacterium]|nr:S9 family peptidase [Candidatus Polarisedimenticolia bacterium]
MRTRVLGIVLFAAVGMLLAPAALLHGQPAKRLITVADMNAIRDVSGPDFSPDGQWVAYGVSYVNTKRDKSDSDLYMTSWDGSRTLRLTSSPAKEHTPRFSPDGKWIGFLSKRATKPKADQVWLLPRDGGEAQRLTDLKGGVTDFAFSPDGKKLVVAADDPDPEDLEKEKKDSQEEDEADDGDDDEPTPKPIVINRYQFKVDEEGWLRAGRSHLYLVDLATRK